MSVGKSEKSDHCFQRYHEIDIVSRQRERGSGFYFIRVVEFHTVDVFGFCPEPFYIGACHGPYRYVNDAVACTEFSFRGWNQKTFDLVLF